MQFVKRVGRFVHLQPLAINRRLATRRMSYAPDAHAHTDGRTDARTWYRFFCHLQLTKAGTERKQERQRQKGGEGTADERPCWQFFMHLTIETSTLPCPGHPSIYSFIHSPARSLARPLIHALRHSFIHSSTHRGRWPYVFCLLDTCWGPSD